MKRTSSPRKGMALVLALIVGLIVFALAFFGALVASDVMRGAGETWEMRQALYAAEAGVNKSIRELTLSTDANGDGLGTLPSTTLGTSGAFTVVATVGGSGEYTIRSLGQLNNSKRRIEVVVRQGLVPVSLDFRAAITANGPVTTLGGITVDGRDWDYNNTSVVGGGVWGISSRSTIDVNGSSSVGGNGTAPIGNATGGDNVFEASADWSDGTDQDSDSSTDEEAFDGIDNDGDGQIDEDTSDFPAGPDVFLKIPGGTLQSVAQSMGTYFTSQAQLDAYRTANGGNLPGGKVYYLDFSVCQPMDFGATMNSAPSILVHHTSAGNAKMKNVHGQFKGLLMVDGMEHINADTTILGAIVSFTPFTVGNAYGNGGATIRFSSAVLGGLPPMMLSGGAWPIISWREISAN